MAGKSNVSKLDVGSVHPHSGRNNPKDNMYKIIGGDGKEYGPITIEVLTDWAKQGRVNPQTRVQAEGSADWKPAAEYPELQAIFAGVAAAAAPGPISAGASAGAPQQSGLAITSLVLGILGLVCMLGPLTGIPAIICGHIAHNRTRRDPQQYGGGGMAIAGFVLGYVSLVYLFVLAGMLLPALAKAKSRAQQINCTNNMKQIGLAFKVWAIDHNDQFPFNVSTNAGGTMQLSQRSPDGTDRNSFLHLQVMSNELSSTKILVCPADTKQPASAWQAMQAANVSYQVYSGENVNDTNPQQVLAVCPIHKTIVRVDGSVQSGTSMGRSR